MILKIMLLELFILRISEILYLGPPGPAGAEGPQGLYELVLYS